MSGRPRLAAARGALLLLAAGCEAPSGPVLPYPAPPARGATVVDWTEWGYAAPSCQGTLDRIAAAGGNAVAIVVTLYQSDTAASRVRATSRTASPQAVADAAQQARARGLDVALKLHVDVETGTWRGRIAPRDPEAWFRDYGQLALSWARAAESWGCHRLVAGTELAGTLQEEDRWRALLKDLTAAFSGEVVYAASWDEALLVPFWDAVDFVGVNAYFPVATRRDPTRVDLLAGWQAWLARVEMLHRRTGKPILFTEIGYRSVDGAGMDPFAHDGSAERLDADEQADLYWAALRAVDGVDWLAGTYWWNWPASGASGQAGGGYSPMGKPAEQVLAAFWNGE